MADTETAITSTVESVSISLIGGILPFVSDASTIGKILTLVQAWLPYIQQEAIILVDPVKNTIAALPNNGAMTPDKRTALETIDAQVDTAYANAWAAYQAAHPTPVT